MSALATPYRPTSVFMPTYTPTKGSYFCQLLLSGPIDTNPTFKDNVQWLQAFVVWAYRIQDLFLYIVVFKDLNQVLREAL